MDEKRLILNAIRNKESVHGLQDDDFADIGVESGKDAISKLAKAYFRKDSWKRKPCLQWNNADFIRYLDSILKEFGVPRSVSNIRKDSYYLDTLYDTMSKVLNDNMNNDVLRDYIQWWCSIKAPRLTGSGFHLKYLLSASMVGKFVLRYKADNSPIEEIIAVDVSDTEIYNLGGVSLLLIKRGLVVCREVCLQQGKAPSNVRRKMLESLLAFNAGVLRNVVKVTLNNAPYARSMRFDFLSMISSLLSDHGLVEFSGLDYESYFAD